MLRESAARELGVRVRELRAVAESEVPEGARDVALRNREELEGAPDPIRFYAGGGAFVALVPSYSFEGEDPHVVRAFDAAGRPTGAILPTYGAVEVYCPAGRPPAPGSSARDSTDGCRYFHPVPQEPAPP